MNDAQAPTLIHRFWQLANQRQWSDFATLLHPKVIYTVPQTRERVCGCDGFVDFFATWPGNWTVHVNVQIADDKQAVTRFDFVDESGTVTGMSFFEFADGLITKIVDYWPDSYEPPPRLSSHVERY